MTSETTAAAGAVPGRALLITRAFPAAAGTGAQQRSFNHLLALLHYERVDVLVPVHEVTDPSEVEAQVAAVAALSPRIGWVRAVRAPQSPDFQSTLRVFLPPDGAAQVADLRIRDYATVLCFRVFALHFAEAHLGAVCGDPDMPRIVVDFDDVESVAIWREAAGKRDENGLRRTLALRWQAVRRFFHEHGAQARADAVMVCSAVDRARLVNRRTGEVHTIPNSVAVPEQFPEGERNGETDGIRLLFVGALFYPPNVDAMQWFVREIYPQVRAELGATVRLDLVGRRPTADVLALADEAAGVYVTADVPSVEPWYADADVVVAPIRFGGGTRIKILEALALGKSVVTTTVSAEGIDLVPGEHAAFADSAADFAAAVVRLARDEGVRQHMARAGWERVAALYSAATIQAREFREVLAPRV